MNINQTKTPIIDTLLKFDKLNPDYYCMPSHHRGSCADESFLMLSDTILKYDLTETPITDDLHEPEYAIAEAQQLASELFGADKTFFLVNGTTCGNEAMIISSVHEGDKILISRNCHKSILMGLIISGATPIYIEPEKSSKLNTFGSISPQKVEQAFKENTDIRAFILVNPTYYGICSDLKAIADICHSHNALLLVDEAHGAAFSVSDKLPLSAMQSGADMCSQSIHKTAGAMTQSSMLHIKGTLADISKVDSALKIVQSTSPSYILMASLDAARHKLAVNGKYDIEHLIKLSDYIRNGLNSIDGVNCYDKHSDTEVFDFDRTRIVFSIDNKCGFDIFDELFNNYNICAEMADDFNVVLILGPSDSIKQANRLIAAVKKIANKKESSRNSEFSMPVIPSMALTPRAAYFSKTESIPLEKAEGKISTEMIAPYPPGIPVIYPGEVFTADIIEFISDAIKEKRHIHGFSDKTMQTVKICIN